MSNLARQLVLDEIFDLSLYRALRGVAPEPQRDILDQLIVVETQHVAYWQRYIATGSEAEVRSTEQERKRFLGEPVTDEAGESPVGAALVVGIGYMAGALVPLLPVLFGSRGMLPTIVAAGVVLVAVSAIVAFLSGMDVRRRIALNAAVTGIAVAVTYAIGLAAKAVLGVSF